MNFRDLLSRDQRLAILRLLREVGGHANESVMQTGLQMLGHKLLTRDQVRDHFRFLAEAGCVTLEWFNDTVVVASLTERGLDVAAGRTPVEGISTPSKVG